MATNSTSARRVWAARSRVATWQTVTVGEALRLWSRIIAMGLPTISLWPTTTVSLPARSGQVRRSSSTAAMGVQGATTPPP